MIPQQVRQIVLVTVLVGVVLLTGNRVYARNIRAVATFSVIADMVEQVGGERVQVTSIVPLGGDPHSWEPTPREARSVAGADVLFYNGQGFEIWVDRLIQNTARRDLPIIVLSEGLTPLPAPTFAAHAHESGDPHFWLNVEHAMYYVTRIEQALVNIDPQNAPYYRANAQRYLTELVELDQWLERQVEKIPVEKRRIITYHDAFGHLADRYGLSVEGFLVVNPEREPSAREMAELTRMLGRYPNPVIFSEPQISSGSRYVQALAREVGGTVYQLYSDSLSHQNPTYVAMMRHNGRTLVEALQ